MRSVLPLLVLLGCGDPIHDVPGASWVGDPVAERPADPPPLDLPGAKPDAAAPKLTAVAPPPRARGRRTLPPPTRRANAPAPTPAEAPPTGGLSGTAEVAEADADAAALMGHAEAMISQRKYRQALGSAKRAQAKAPRDPDVAALVGRVYAALRNHYAAADAFNRALRLAPEHAEAMYGLARAQIGMKRLDAAKATLARLERAHPENRRIHELRAAMGLAAGDEEAAAESLKKVADKHPDDPAALARLGNSLARQGKYEEAIAALKKAVAKRPRDGKLLLQLGTAQGLAGDLAAADATLARAARQSNSKEAWSNLAATREQRGDLKGAVAAWKRMRSLVPPPQRPKLDQRVRMLNERIEAEASKP